MGNDNELDRLSEIHDELREITRLWNRGENWDEDKTRALREEAVLINHKRYIRNIPAYRILAEEVGVGEDLSDVEIIKTDLMSTTDIFKSYDPALIDNSDWQQMTEWLRSIYHKDIPGDFSKVKKLEEWLEKLLENGVNILTSSGTSGNYSFVPRDDLTRSELMNNSITVLQPVLGLIQDLTQFDAALLSFKSGSAGVQAVSNGIANAVQNSYYLYDMHMPADAVRILQRGATNEEEQKFLDEFQRVMVTEKDIRYEVMLDNIRESIKNGRKILLQGVCFQLKELCTMAVRQGIVKLPEGSVLLFGGGWKTFEGEKIGKPELLKLIESAFGLKKDRAIEGYSMTEMNTMMTCCEEGRFHIPPLMEPMVFDEDLMPMQNQGNTGLYGFLDPFAMSYPGFLISGDQIDLWHGECVCGRKGYAIDGEIRRAPGKEVKGCGGIMASVKA